MSASGPSTDRTHDGPLLRNLMAAASPTAAGSPDARRAVAALQQLRSQLAETQAVLDDFLMRLDDAARPRRDAG